MALSLCTMGFPLISINPNHEIAGWQDDPSPVSSFFVLVFFFLLNLFWNHNPNDKVDVKKLLDFCLCCSIWLDSDYHDSMEIICIQRKSLFSALVNLINHLAFFFPATLEKKNLFPGVCFALVKASSTLFRYVHLNNMGLPPHGLF